MADEPGRGFRWTMKLIKATIITLREGSDRVFLQVDLPDACYPYQERLSLGFNCARGSALDYVRTHFPDVPIERVVGDSKG